LKIQKYDTDEAVLPFESLDQVIKSIERNSLMIRILDRIIKPAFMMVHYKIWEDLIAKVKQDGEKWARRSSYECEHREKRKKLIDSLSSHTPMSVQIMSENELFPEFRFRTMVQIYLRSMIEQNDPAAPDEGGVANAMRFRNQMAQLDDVVTFDVAMNLLRTPWLPQCGQGSQNDDWLHGALLTSMRSVRSENRKSRRNYDE
jgi:hypothetical protein